MRAPDLLSSGVLPVAWASECSLVFHFPETVRQVFATICLRVHKFSIVQSIVSEAVRLRNMMEKAQVLRMGPELCAGTHELMDIDGR